MTILYFGQIRGITKLSQEAISFEGDLQQLRSYLIEKYPALAQVDFVFAVNKKIMTNVNLSAADEIALLPPFSGG